MRKSIIELAAHRSRGQHPGLLLQRFLSRTATGVDGDPEERRSLFDAVRASAASAEVLTLYSRAFARWTAATPANDYCHFATLSTAGRLIVGLGCESVLETGLRLHQTYGMPVIPGSALKGLANHYCDQVWGQKNAELVLPENEQFRREMKYHNLLFGRTDDAGVIAFHDAWITPDSVANCLCLDVMTPHHPEWQMNQAAPTDFDGPIPVSFLSVEGQFRVGVSWAGPLDHPQAKNWTELAFVLLKESLAQWGAGGKTSSGYGRLVAQTEIQPTTGTATSSTPKQKRASGTPTKVKIVAPRATGFDVQEEGRSRGTLTLGSPPPGISTEVDQIVDVQVHDDVANRPQYKWPPAASTGKPTKPPKKK